MHVHLEVLTAPRVKLVMKLKTVAATVVLSGR